MSFACVAIATVLLTSCSQDGSQKSVHPKVIVLGFDGMDPRMCERLMDAGSLPNMARMRDGGGYKPLGTSTPPQSPVAWSNFITGAGPGAHGIFDFIHRDPTRQYSPYYSAAETKTSDEGWEIGAHRLPLTFWPFNHNPTQTLLKRGGTPFWDYLDAAGVPIRIYDIPANYPPSPSKHGHMCCLSGMGVPDLLGTYGTYQHFAEDTFRVIEEGGGIKKPIVFRGNVAKAKLTGPDNTYLKRPVKVVVSFEIFRHPDKPAARIELQDQTILLNEGEWSDWQKVDFRLEMPPFLPDDHAKGICRFYLQEVRPNFRLYVTPINIDPSDPSGQIVSEPESFVEDIAEDLGLFYTAGFQEDHKALSTGVFKDAEYEAQAKYVLEERMNLLAHALANYRDGLLFFYFSSTDLQAHMFWWDTDAKHPVRASEEAKRYHAVIENLYGRMDKVIGDVVERYGDEATILVMSDHGFCNFHRQFNLNRWLRDNGYIQPATCKSLLDPRQIDWGQTRAYGLGLNGLYLNLRGRERDGIVDPADRDALLEELREKLLRVRDPLNGEPVIAVVDRADEVYRGPFVAQAPDLIVGYHRDYRASWATTLGDMNEEVVSDNDSAWSADHCIAAEEVPGVIFSNRPILRERPSLVDLAPTILKEFGIVPPAEMTGGSLFGSRVAAAAH